MKNSLLLLVLLTFSCGARDRGARPPVQGEVEGNDALTVMTYNIRMNTDRDRENAWPRRQEFLASQILFHAPEVLGIQEGLPDQVKWLDDRLADYAMIGEGRRGRNKGEFSAIYYDRRLLRERDSGTFWLSKTPQRVSTGWDAALPRICTWARFQRLSDRREFFVFNTHFDHVGATARLESAGLLTGMIRSKNRDGLPVILMGDLNLRPEEEPIRLLARNLVDTYTTAPVRLGPAATYNAFNYDYRRENYGRIDYVFASSNWRVQKYATLTDAIDGRFASDHFPVVAVLGWE